MDSNRLSCIVMNDTFIGNKKELLDSDEGTVKR